MQRDNATEPEECLQLPSVLPVGRPRGLVVPSASPDDVVERRIGIAGPRREEGLARRRCDFRTRRSSIMGQTIV